MVDFVRVSWRVFIVFVYVGSHCKRNVAESARSQETCLLRTPCACVVMLRCTRHQPAGLRLQGGSYFVKREGDGDPVPEPLPPLLSDSEE